MWLFNENDTLLGKKCIHHKKTQEKAIVGRYGEIWMYSGNDEILCARVVSHKVANKLAKLFKKEPGYCSGDEMLLKFKFQDYNVVASYLKIARSQEVQLHLMETVLT